VALAPVPYGTPLTGANATAWAKAILAGLGAPQTQANVQSLTDWFALEGGGGQNNPLNTSLVDTGSTGAINSSGVQGYATPQDGVNATVATLQGGYSAITGALDTGKGLVDDTASAVEAELRKWSGWRRSGARAPSVCWSARLGRHPYL